MVELLEREQNLRMQLEPHLGEAYDAHMKRPGGRSIGEAEDDLPLETGTLDSLGLMYRFAGLPEENGITPQLVEALRTSHAEHIEKYEKQGVDLRPIIRTGLYINQATEDNLPWYTGQIFLTAHESEKFTAWLSRWTSEESFHADIIRDYGSMSGALDTKAAHRAKAQQLMKRMHVNTDTYAGTFAFTDPQEGLTFDAHQNVGSLLDAIGRQSMQRVAGQENTHQKYFRSGNKFMVAIDPEYVLPIIAPVWRRFAMPGKEGIPGFDDYSLQLAVQGVFTMAMMRKQQRDVAEDLGLLELPVKTDEAKKAQANIAVTLDMTSKVNRVIDLKVEAATEQYIAAEKAAGRIPIILGRTVVFERAKKELVVYPEAA